MDININLKLEKKLQEKCLKEIQHNKTSTLSAIKSRNPSFHWCSISYEKTGDTALHIAARLGHIETIEYLLSEYSPCTVNVRNKDDKTPLHEAAQFSQLHSVIKLCSYKSDVNALRRGDWTPLMLACTKIQCEASNLSIAETLVDQGAHINLANKDGWTCVHIIAREGGKMIYNYLVKHGLKIGAKTKNGRTALHIAALHGQRGILISLLDVIDINSRDSCGNTPFHEAILGQHLNIAKLLVEKGADINARNNNDWNALHLTANQDSFEMVDYLLRELNFDINFQNKQGLTVAHCAARKGSKKLICYFKENGADLSVKDNFNRTPLDYLMAD